jgi:hypothetical protein
MNVGKGLGLGVRLGNYAPIPPLPILDQFPNANYAYSMRLLRIGYVGNCIRIRRSSDNAETDIGFVSNYVDEAAITSFIGSDTAYITTWYDQSGNGVNKVQTTAASQPYIAKVGVVSSYLGFVAQESNSTKYGGLYNVMTSGGVTSQAFNVMKVGLNAEVLPATNTNAAATRFYGLMQPNASSPTLSSGTPTYYKNSVSISSPTRQTLYDSFNTQFAVLTTKDVDLSAWTESSSLYPSYRGIQNYSMEEIVYFTTTQDRALIEANQIAYYGL